MEKKPAEGFQVRPLGVGFRVADFFCFPTLKGMNRLPDYSLAYNRQGNSHIRTL
jgi:hypothetical protein